jgi:exopolysaccharide biosynthesis predicted pyruvyltransferase EpsI
MSLVNPLVPSGPIALLDYPNHGNVGDSAIWLGEAVWVASRPDCQVRYVADYESFDAGALRAAMPTGTVLMHGGGNFGDLWTDFQRFRERCLRELTDYRIVQLPQSIWFNDPAAADAAGQLARAHPDYTVLVRSRASQQRAVQQLGLERVLLVPDAAFLLDQLRAPRATRDIVLLARTDKERRHLLEINGIEPEDWLRDTGVMTHWRYEAFTFWAFGKGGVRGRVIAPRWANHMARRRVARGLAQIGRGRTLITDRLHACILGVLIGRHVLAVDNTYGKLRAVVDTWFPDCPAITWIDDPSDIARALVSAQ